MHQQQGLDSILKLISLNGYSIFSLIDGILARGEWEDKRIKLLQEGITRDAVDICACLLSHKPASASISAWALEVVQSAEVEWVPTKGHDMRYNNAWAAMGDPESVSERVQSKHGATVDILPDNVFLDIFNFCLYDNPDTISNPLERTRKWQTLVHVCQRWRRIIFASPRHLDLYLSCSYGTHVRKNLVFWPVGLPLTVDYPIPLDPTRGVDLPPDEEDNITFALDHAHRVLRIEVPLTYSLLSEVFTIMQKSFPVLTHLDLFYDRIRLASPFPVIPERFLGGSAPNLQYLSLRRISFPQLPTFLLSAPNLVTLKLEERSQSGYISPEVMVRSLAVLNRLTYFSLSFCDFRSPPVQWTSHPNPPVRAILPALTRFHYRGRSEYLEDFLAQVNTPQLINFLIECFAHQIQLEIPQLSQFIGRIENLKIDHFRQATVLFFPKAIVVILDCRCCQAEWCLEIMNEGRLENQVSRMVHVLGQLVATFSKVDHLTTHGNLADTGGTNITEWLPFFRLFPAVEALHISGGVAASIASALEDTADSGVMVTDIFPELYLIWLDEGNDEHVLMRSIEGFLSLRRLSGHAVTVVDTKDKFSDAERRPL